MNKSESQKPMIRCSRSVPYGDKPILANLYFFTPHDPVIISAIYLLDFVS